MRSKWISCHNKINYFYFSFRFVIVLWELVELGGVDVVGGEEEVLAVDGPS